LTPGYGVVSPGWSTAIWIRLQSFEYAAHFLSAAGGGYSLRLSVNPSTQMLELVHNGINLRTCTGNSKIPLYVWTLIGVTQRNNSATAYLNAQTELFVNGISDKNCSTLSVKCKTCAYSRGRQRQAVHVRDESRSSLTLRPVLTPTVFILLFVLLLVFFVCSPYWGDLPLENKGNMYIGYDPISNDPDVLHAYLALWTFWYFPLDSIEQAALAAELPLSISGPLQVTVTPPLEDGAPLLDATPLVLSVVPQSSVKGPNSTFTMCLRSDPSGGASPACLTWTSTSALTPKTVTLTNPQKGNIAFWWESSFTGTDLPGGLSQEYYKSLFTLPRNMSFAKTVPFEQLSVGLHSTCTPRAVHLCFPLPMLMLSFLLSPSVFAVRPVGTRLVCIRSSSRPTPSSLLRPVQWCLGTACPAVPPARVSLTWTCTIPTRG